QKLNSGWVAGGDGLLVMDRNGDGSINDGSELFGNGVTLSNGLRAGNGYMALAELDSSQDGVIDAGDSDFSRLMVWVDQNGDGVSEASELRSLQELNITSLSLNAERTQTVDNGNLVGLTSSYTTADGQTHEMAD